MIFTDSKITNRLMVAGAIALGSAISYNDSALSETATYTKNQPTDFTVSGVLQSARIYTYLTAGIRYSTCPNGGKSVTRRFTKNLINPTLSDPEPYLVALECAPVSTEDKPSARTRTTINTVLPVIKPNQNIFKGSFTTAGSVTRSIFGNGGVSAFSYSTLRVSTLVQQPTGSFQSPAPIYNLTRIPKNPLTFNTTVSYLVQSAASGIPLTAASAGGENSLSSQNVLDSGFLFSTQTNIDGDFNWDNDSIDFSNVVKGTFGIEFGEYSTKEGALFLKFDDGCVTEAEESGYFRGWLPEVGTCEDFSLTREGGLDLSFDYKLPDFGQDVNFSLNMSSRSVPEPMTVIGTLVCLGFGGFFKRKYRQNRR